MRIGFLGFGNMAQALADGLLASEPGLVSYAGQTETNGQVSHPDQDRPAASPSALQLGATALHRDKLVRNCQARGLEAFATAEDLVDFSDLLVLAVKPWQLATLLPPLQAKLQGKLVVSVAAGKGFEDLEALLPGLPHITALPNLPVAVGQGLLICEEKHSLNPGQLASFEEIFGRLGKIYYLPPDQFSAGATISGCGPAFTAVYIEALADVGVKHGLKRDLALSLAAQMTAGSGSLVAAGNHPARVKDQVCSPGGTTIRGVIALERHGFRGAVTEAIDAIEGS